MTLTDWLQMNDADRVRAERSRRPDATVVQPAVDSEGYRTMLAYAESCQREALLLLADAAEEGGQGDLASGYRWLAEHRRWPVRHGVPVASKGYVDLWGFSDGDYPPAWTSYTLPAGAYRRYVTGSGDVSGSRSLTATLEQAALAVGAWLADTKQPSPQE